MFEQAGEDVLRPRQFLGIPRPASMIMDEIFQRLVPLAIVSGKLPCMISIELGVLGVSNGEGGTAALKMEPRAVLGVNTEIVVKETARPVYDFLEILRWN